MSMATIESYYKSNIYKPFYMAVGDEEYRYLKSKLTESGDVEFVHLSKCCRNADKKPDIDKLRETLRMADIDCDSNKIVLLGLGEYLSLEGSAFARSVLNELITFNLGSAHAVFLLRGVSTQVREMLMSDPRYENRQIAISANPTSSLSFMFSSLDLGIYEETGFQKALEIAEDGVEEKICVNTAMSFPDSLYPLQVVRNPYEAICKKIKGFVLPKHLGTNSNWEDLLKEINQYGSLDSVFKRHRFDDSLNDFYEKVSGTQYEHWLYYLYLTKNKESLANIYLKFVLDSSNDFDDFTYKVLNAIIGVSHTQKNYQQLYEDRKRLIAQYPNADIAVFVSNNRFDPAESVYKLTDNTLVEREEIIADISQHGIPDRLDRIYPALAMYLKKYHFQGDAISQLLTDYFEEYKEQKVTNDLHPEFLKKVDQLAVERVYN